MRGVEGKAAVGKPGHEGRLPAPQRWTVEEYYRMAKAGILGEDDRVELLDGEIIEMAPIGSPHAGHLIFLNAWFGRGLAGRALVSVQNPVRLSPRSEPQPDLAILRPRPDFYSTAHPTPVEVLLIVEVADTTLRYDRDVKLPRYARAGIPEAWVVDLPRTRILAARDPSPEGYGRIETVARGGSIAPLAFPDLVLHLDDLFSPATGET